MIYRRVSPTFTSIYPTFSLILIAFPAISSFIIIGLLIVNIYHKCSSKSLILSVRSTLISFFVTSLSYLCGSLKFHIYLIFSAYLFQFLSSPLPFSRSLLSCPYLWVTPCPFHLMDTSSAATTPLQSFLTSLLTSPL